MPIFTGKLHQGLNSLLSVQVGIDIILFMFAYENEGQANPGASFANEIS